MQPRSKSARSSKVTAKSHRPQTPQNTTRSRLARSFKKSKRSFATSSRKRFTEPTVSPTEPKLGLFQSVSLQQPHLVTTRSSPNSKKQHFPSLLRINSQSTFHSRSTRANVNQNAHQHKVWSKTAPVHFHTPSTIPQLQFTTTHRPFSTDAKGQGSAKSNSDTATDGSPAAAGSWYRDNKMYQMYKRYGKLAIISIAGVYAAGFVVMTTVPLLIPGYDPESAVAWLNENGYIPQVAKDSFNQLSERFPEIGDPIKANPDIASKVLAGYLLNEVAVVPRLALALAITKSVGDKRIAAREAALANKDHQRDL